MHTMEYVYQQGNYSCTKQRDESRKHYVEWKEPDTNAYVLYDSIYLNLTILTLDI